MPTETESPARTVKAGDLIRTQYGDLHVRDVFVNVQLDNRMDVSFHADDPVIIITEA